MIQALESDKHHSSTILSLSHDEMEKLKRLHRMDGLSDEQREQQYRLLVSIMASVPGHKLHFMGMNYSGDGSCIWLDSMLSKQHAMFDDSDAATDALVAELNALYLDEPALHGNAACDIEWLKRECPDQQLIAVRRRATQAASPSMAIFYNIDTEFPSKFSYAIPNSYSPEIHWSSQ